MNGDLLKYSKYGWPFVCGILTIALIVVVIAFLNFMGNSLLPVLTDVTKAVNKLEITISSKTGAAEIRNSLDSLASLVSEPSELDEPPDDLFGPVEFDMSPEYSTPADRAKMATTVHSKGGG